MLGDFVLGALVSLLTILYVLAIRDLLDGDSA